MKNYLYTTVLILLYAVFSWFVLHPIAMWFVGYPIALIFECILGWVVSIVLTDILIIKKLPVQEALNSMKNLIVALVFCTLLALLALACITFLGVVLGLVVCIALVGALVVLSTNYAIQWDVDEL